MYERRLDDNFMESVICQEDHFYHRTAKALSNNNIEPVVYYLSQEKQEKKFTHKYGHTIIRIPARRIGFIHEPIVYSSKLIESIRKDYEICDFVSGYYIMYKVPDMFDYAVFKLNKQMPIITRWTGGNHKWLFPIRRTIKKASLQRCDKILASSLDEIRVLETLFEIPKEKLAHLIYPIDFSLFKKRDKTTVAEKISIDLGFRYLLYVGRLTKNKGLELLLEVFNELEPKYEDLKLIIIGDGPLLPFINEFVKNHNLEKKIIVTGRLTHDTICYYYNIATILINIGLSGGVPNVIIESLASGLPVIATDVGASKEFISDERRNGVLIRPSDKIELKNAIIKILENEHVYKNYDTAFLDEFSYDSFGKKLSSIYTELLKK